MFKYLENANGGAQAKSAAQAYIDKSQSKNKYASVSDPNNPYSMGEGIVGEGPLYDMQNPTKNGGSSAATVSSSGGGDYSHMTGDSDTERNYREGNWGKGSLDAEALAAKFGLDRSQEGEGEGHIWGTNADGSKVYIGKSNDDLKNNEELIKAHSKQANSEEVDHSGVPESLSSSGDVKGAILTQWKGGGGSAPAAAPVQEEANLPITHSPEIREAKMRVKQYETDVLSGKTSNEIYGDSQALALDQVNFDTRQGNTGIGTNPASAAGQASNDATASFLENEVANVKDKYKFSPNQGTGLQL